MTDKYPLPAHFKIIAGGQAGADIAALDWAIAHDIDHGGWCPKGRKSEDGLINERYRLTETPSANYLQRTEWNVRDSDATLIFTLDEDLEGGSRQTAQFAKKHDKPWLHFRPGVHPKYIARFLVQRQVHTLNVAGKRASRAPGIYELVNNALTEALAPTGIERARPPAI